VGALGLLAIYVERGEKNHADGRSQGMKEFRRGTQSSRV
jgi:hypothetical protein